MFPATIISMCIGLNGRHFIKDGQHNYTSQKRNETYIDMWHLFVRVYMTCSLNLFFFLSPIQPIIHLFFILFRDDMYHAHDGDE